MTTEHQAYFGKDLEAMSFANNYHRWIVDAFAPYLGERVAEVGAGTGNFSSFLLEAGVRHLAAFEPSQNMYPLLQQKFADSAQVDTYNRFFEQASEEFVGAFDAVIYVNVLEHIEHDGLALQHALRSLKPGGHLLIFVPALKFLYSELDRKVGHFRRYTRPQLRDLVSGTGFKIIDLRYFDIIGIVPWYLAFVLMKQTTTGTNVSLYDRWVVPVMRPIEKRIKPPLGKNLLLIASKP